MFSCFGKSHGSRRKKGKGGLFGRLWGRLVCLLTYLSSSPKVEDQGQKELHRLFKPLKFDYQRPNFLKKVVRYLPTAVRKGERDFVYTFIALYPAFATPWELLELIAKLIMYASDHAFIWDEYRINSGLLLFLILWMQKMPHDFRMSRDRLLLRKVVDYLHQNLPAAFSEFHVHELMEQLEAQVSMKTLEADEEARDRGFSRATTPVAPVLDATEMQEMPHPRPPSVAGQQGDLQPQEDTEIMDLAVEGKTLPEAGPVQPRPTSADPAEVGIYIRDSGYRSSVVPVVPLPDVDV